MLRDYRCTASLEYMVLIEPKIPEVLLISRSCFIVDNLSCLYGNHLATRPWVVEAMFAEVATPPDLLKL